MGDKWLEWWRGQRVMEEEWTMAGNTAGLTHGVLALRWALSKMQTALA